MAEVLHSMSMQRYFISPNVTASFVLCKRPGPALTTAFKIYLLSTIPLRIQPTKVL